MAPATPDLVPAASTFTIDPASIRDALRLPPPGAWFGVHVQTSDTARPARRRSSPTSRLPSADPLAIDHWYEPWPSIFPKWREQWDIDHGRIPMISWGKQTSDTVTSGAEDAYITARADGISGP